MNLLADNSARRYPAAAAARAREMRDTGWSLTGIADAIEREFGARPSDSTILGWTDPTYARRRYDRKAKQRAKSYSGRRGFAHHSPIARYVRLVALRDAGLSQRATAAVLTLDYGTPISEQQVRHAERSGLYPAGRRGRRPQEATA